MADSPSTSTPSTSPTTTTASPAIYPAGSAAPAATPAPFQAGSPAPVATPAGSPSKETTDAPAVNTASTIEEAQARGEPLVLRPFGGR